MELCFNGVIEVLKNRENLRFADDKVDPVRRVWSSMKATNHHFPDEFVILEGPQTPL